MDLETHLSAVAVRDLGQGAEVEIVDVIADMVAHPEYPCLGARSVFRREAATVKVFEALDSPRTLDEVGEQLVAFTAEQEGNADFGSFVAVFRGPQIVDEADFEDLLWRALQHLHDGDPHPWADGVSANPEEAHFSFSHRGTAYFIVGLNPRASRIARRAPLPTLVFNLHSQFERLRAEGGFERMRDTIRARDARLQGEPNPMAADYGETSEARQYSGRAVEEDWTPPFEPKPSAHEGEPHA
ncbi:MAG: guanitoxin biosynthesis heme-dependent pre-guanitoxin N-hydroxylase GntA [Propionibacteriaceae bacterium]|nr:guanitoxin biosynthesis heme-dependent pre-guanitoxin N-hydroxylase GntA [Propionibacteriaceae bacterium]